MAVAQGFTARGHQTGSALECRVDCKCAMRSSAYDTLLRVRAQRVDSQRGGVSESRGVWHSLLDGTLKIADSFFSDERWYLLLREAHGVPVAASARRLLESVLGGTSQKHAAIDADLSPSSISTSIRRALDLMGAARTPVKAPPMLALFALESAGVVVPRARFSELEHAGVGYKVVSVERPERAFVEALPRAEYEVICRVVEGSTHADIAMERRRSPRTVANQIAAAFRRLRVSSRGELIAFFLERADSRTGRGAGLSVDRELVSREIVRVRGDHLATALLCSAASGVAP